MKRRSDSKAAKVNDLEAANENELLEAGKFTFRNGDVYDGEYKINVDRSLLVKQGKGTYTTDNFDVYRGDWDNDSFADNDIHIKYNNDAQYRGRIDPNGAMSGPGMYIFPDGSSIEAVWLGNIPLTNIIYKDPLGFAWTVEDVSKDVKRTLGSLTHSLRIAPKDSSKYLFIPFLLAQNLSLTYSYAFSFINVRNK